MYDQARPASLALSPRGVKRGRSDPGAAARRSFCPEVSSSLPKGSPSLPFRGALLDSGADRPAAWDAAFGADGQALSEDEIRLQCAQQQTTALPEEVAAPPTTPDLAEADTPCRKPRGIKRRRAALKRKGTRFCFVFICARARTRTLSPTSKPVGACVLLQFCSCCVAAENDGFLSISPLSSHEGFPQR